MWPFSYGGYFFPTFAYFCLLLLTFERQQKAGKRQEKEQPQKKKEQPQKEKNSKRTEKEKTRAPALAGLYPCLYLRACGACRVNVAP